MKFDQNNVLIGLFFILMLSVFFLPHSDTDFGWHYRCGYELLHLQSPCINNTFSYFLSEYKWANPTFLYDLLLSITFDAFGFTGVSIIGAILTALTTYIIFKTMKGASLIKVALISISTYYAMSTLSLGFRSQHISLLFLFIEIYLILNKRIYILPVLFLVWANSHAGFFLGPLVFGLYTIGVSYKRVFKKIDINELFKTFFVLGISFLVTLANPFGYKVYMEIYHHIQIPMHTIIAEWVPPNHLQILLILLFSITYLFKHLSSNGYRNYNVFFILLVLLSAYLAITARRNLPIFYYVLALASSYEFQSYEFPKKTKQTITDIAIILIFTATLKFGSSNIYTTLTYPKTRETFLENQIAYFKEKSGNIYNTYEWGGFLIWKLPNMKVFVDGRMPAWIGENGESPYTTWLKITQTQLGWEQTLNRYQTDYLLIANGTFLDLLLRENPSKFNYTEVQRDEQGVIYEYKTN